jgi:hypothetical protein
MSWYDNEWGFSNRMSDTAVAMGKLLEALNASWFETRAEEARSSP